MLEADSVNGQGRDRVLSVILSVVADGDICLAKCNLHRYSVRCSKYTISWNLTGLASDVTVQSREDKVTILELLGAALAQDNVAERPRHGRGLLPPDGILVLLAKGTL
jgi:hypothetical protein